MLRNITGFFYAVNFPNALLTLKGTATAFCGTATAKHSLKPI
jgi:hypothetical protein